MSSCPLCRSPILPSEDYTVRACCKVRYHAGCIHRRYVSGPRACPKCGKEPSLPFDEAPGAVPARVKEDPISRGGVIGRVLGSLSFGATGRSRDLTVREMLENGWTWREMREAGATKEELVERGLDLELAKRHAVELKSVFGFTQADRALLTKTG